MTTILAVRHNKQVSIGGDGQVSHGSTMVKGEAVKIRRLDGGKVLAGFAGSTADAMTLLEKYEVMLKKYQGNVAKAAVELAKEWRTDKILRRLESLLLVVDLENLLLVSGQGDVIAPDDGVAAIGSGGSFALAAARALLGHSTLGAEEVVRESLKIAASICIYTNDHVTIETLG